MDPCDKHRDDGRGGCQHNLPPSPKPPLHSLPSPSRKPGGGPADGEGDDGAVGGADVPRWAMSPQAAFGPAASLMLRKGSKRHHLNRLQAFRIGRADPGAGVRNEDVRRPFVPAVGQTRPAIRGGRGRPNHPGVTGLWRLGRFRRPRQGESLAPAPPMTITATPSNGRSGDRTPHSNVRFPDRPLFLPLRSRHSRWRGTAARARRNGGGDGVPASERVSATLKGGAEKIALAGCARRRWGVAGKEGGQKPPDQPFLHHGGVYQCETLKLKRLAMGPV